MTTEEYARNIRLLALELCYIKRASHIGGAFSVADILAVLYNEILKLDTKNPKYIKRDRLFYSKGHACTALYAALALKNFFSINELLDNFTENGSFFTSHVNHKISGIELSTGSLGHAFGVACGVAIAGKQKSIDYDVFTILSDGELDEGSNWESILFAAHHHLDNLIAIIDCNKIQSFGRTEEVINLDPLSDKFSAFGWNTYEVNGHSIPELRAILRKDRKNIGRPTCIIANTIKGRGVSFMENQLEWHYKSPSGVEYNMARIELEQR